MTSHGSLTRNRVLATPRIPAAPGMAAHCTVPRWSALLPLLLCATEFCVGAETGSAASGAAGANIDPRLSGGATTVFVSHAGAFSLNAANMSSRRKGDFLIGNDFFEDPWVIAPSSTDLRDGLGPLFNVSACQSCHLNDGRGHAPGSAEDDADSLLIRFSRPSVSAAASDRVHGDRIHGDRIHGDPLHVDPVPGDPVYGGQLQDRGIPGVPAEARIRVSYRERPITFRDGTTITLREPVIAFADWAYGPPAADLVFSPRVAPPVIGMGLLEAIAESDLLALEDPEDRNGDGVSGRANRVPDLAADRMVVGRFGWKAGQPGVRQQTAAAFNGDMGLTTTLFPELSCSSVQTACRDAPDGRDPATGVEVRDDILAFVTHYVSNLAVPARRAIENPAVGHGQRLFQEAGCGTCHVERFTTAVQPAERIEQSRQVIFPYTDLLLHDMGPELADRQLDGQPAPAGQRSEFEADTHEWRTPPLWGIGLSRVVNPEATFLHDGRARTPLEAVLWHGGEAERAKQAVLALDATGRDALVAFLESL